MNAIHILHQGVFGAVAAAGFGILFNVHARILTWCAASGFIALTVRTIVMDKGFSLEVASFVAALAVGLTAFGVHRRQESAATAIGVAGCIPMIPGGYATQAILGLFALSESTTTEQGISSITNLLRVIFTIAAIGSGLAIAGLILPGKILQKSESET